MSSQAVLPVVVGVDIGGTNIDVVLISQNVGKSKVVSEVKELTSKDVTTGVKKAILRALLQATEKGQSVAPVQVNIGSTAFVNAVVQGKDLAKVAAIRICGPVSHELPPFCDFPKKLARIISGHVYLAHGGYRCDGIEHEPFDEDEIRRLVVELKEKGIKNIAYIGVFSPTRPDHEIRAREITKELYPEATVSLSHEIGHIGLLERENATILNECLKPLCQKTVSGFKAGLESIGLTCPFFLTQNDGTIISSEGVLEQPLLAFASGPTNSMRGASFLSDFKDAIVVDIGGTTTDVGVLKNGFPREASSHVTVGGVRTNFRIPDVISIGLGGGSYVKEKRDGRGALKRVTVGPMSAGLNLMKEAFVFGDGIDDKERSLTATDIAVAAGLYSLGDARRVKNLAPDLVKTAVDEIHHMVEELVDKIKLSKEELPVIVVGGGSILMDLSRPLKGATKLIIPDHFGVANAIGAALSKVSCSDFAVANLLERVDELEMERCVQAAVKTVTSDPDGKEADLATIEAKKPFFTKARDEAIDEIVSRIKSHVVSFGANEKTLEVLEKQDTTLDYMPGNAIQIKVKVVGDLAVWEKSPDDIQQWTAPPNYRNILKEESLARVKQMHSSTGQKFAGEEQAEDPDEDRDPTKHPQEPYIDPATGEWILSEWDLECIVLGAGVYGCGGGASIHMGRLRARNFIRSGKKFRVINPDKLLKKADPENDVIIVSAFIGAPLTAYEQGVSSKETTKALECMKDAYEIGGYKDGNLQNTRGANIETNKAGLRFIQNYQPSNRDEKTGMKTIGVMSVEIGGLNSVEPFMIAANMDLPIVDADGMSRAFPEVQMFIPYMCGTPPYPVGIVGSGNDAERTVVLYSPENKPLENFLRGVAIAHGCYAGLAIPLQRDDVLQRSALYTVSSAYRLGDAILRARLDKKSVIDAIVKHEDAEHIITGKIMDVHKVTSGGFDRGCLTIEGLNDFQGKEILIEFQNENLVIIPVVNGKKGECLGCTPDLICIVDANTAEPAQTEEIKYGMRVAVLLMPSHPLLRKESSLKWVGPQAFHYPDDIKFKPTRQRRTTEPVPPQ